MKKQVKWLQVVADYQKTKNVTHTAKKFNITRGTVYKYIDLYNKKLATGQIKPLRA